MPKDTFYNLSKEKKEVVLNAAFLEFENYSYDQSSINRIIANAGISKGSFYQYFKDKKDLYLHILQMIVDKKIHYLTPIMMNPEAHPFFDVVREMNQAALKFAKDHPQYLRVGNLFFKDPNHPIYLEFMADNEKKAAQYYESLLIKAIERGEFREDLNVHLTAHLLFSLSKQMISFDDDITDPSWLEKMFRALDELIDLFAYGMLNQSALKK